MNERKDGGPAFPGNPHHIDNVPDPKTGGTVATIYASQQGMTLRDYFAAKAMQGMLANTDDSDARLHEQGRLFPILARNAYEIADSMLKARSA
jgi:hypothetical protein